MKQILYFIALVLLLQVNAQVTPTLFNQFTIDGEFVTQSIAYYNDEIYMPDAFGGKIIKTDASTLNAPINIVIDNLYFPTGVLVIGNTLYFLEAFTTPFPSQNTGKLSKVDLTDPSLSVVDLLTGLNAPISITGNANNLYITEYITTFEPEFPEELEFESTTISKIQLSSTPTKTVLFQNRDYVYDLKLNANELYWVEELQDDVKLYNYQITQPTPQVNEVFTFGIDDYPERILIENDLLFFATYPFSGNLETPLLSAIDLSESTLSSSLISTPFTFNTSEVYLGGMIVSNNTMHVSAEAYDNDTFEDSGLLFQLDISSLSTLQFEDDLNLRLYPNPAQSQIHFNEVIKELHVLDIKGRVVFSYHNTTDTFNVSKLSPGLYLLKGTTLVGKTFQHKLIKQ